MKRITRKRPNVPIIEVSSSDDENHNKNTDNDFKVKNVNDEQAVKKKKLSTNTITKTKIATKNTKRKTKSIEDKLCNIKTEKLKNFKKEIVHENVFHEPEKKRRKLPEKQAEKKCYSNSIILENETTTTNNIVHQLNLKNKISSGSIECKEWTDIEYICEIHNINSHVAKNIIKLFHDENTIPFIARYRKDKTGGMEPDQLRMIRKSLEEAKLIKQRATTITKAIDKLGQWTPEIHTIIHSIKSLSDLEHIYSSFKTGSKQSLAEKAKALGLGPISNAILSGQNISSLSSFIDTNKSELQTEQQIKDGIIHIIADIISKDKCVFDKVKELQKITIIEIQSTQCKTHENHKSEKKNSNEEKYKLYFNFKATDKNIKPHQILAINRGESQKILTVKVIVPNSFEKAFKSHCSQQYKLATKASKLCFTLLMSSIDYAYKKFIKPMVTRHVRNELKERARSASIQVFATNVKQLLLIPPVKGKVVLGIDPGFTCGCKLAVISEQGNVLETAVMYPHKNSEASQSKSAEILINLVNKHNCTILALGNATACRETEQFLIKLINMNAFKSTDVSYTIVDESGASIYSCTPEAKSEFPNLDVNIISAISIARRLQDPLAELVKIEPKHLGVGMYQHDLPEKRLLLALNEVVTEAVSFVGVDINTASHCLLKRVAGLNVSRATHIIEWRNKHGPFKNREQLLDVKSIGNKTFEQCAGFIRILPETSITTKTKTMSQSSKNVFNPLDQTWIHPESYEIAKEFLKYCDCNLNKIGSVSFINSVKSYEKDGYAALARKFGTNETTMEIIIKGLTMKKDEDIRTKLDAPLFRKNMQNINDLSAGTLLSGVVRNMTHFGAFVDIGVGSNGLIHTSCMKNQSLFIGQQVQVKVLSIERGRNRISLELVNVN